MPDLPDLEPAQRDRSYQTRQRDGIVHDLAEGLRASLGTIRAAIETMTEYPDMDPDIRAQFAEIVRQGAVEASDRLEATMERYAEAAAAERPMHVVPAATVLHRVAEALRADLGLGASGVDVEEPGADLRVRADRTALVGLLVFLGQRVYRAVRSRPITMRVRATGRYAAFDLSWDGAAIQQQRLDRWLGHAFDDGGVAADRIAADVLERHGAEVWAATSGERPALHLLLPLAEEAGPPGRA